MNLRIQARFAVKLGQNSEPLVSKLSANTRYRHRLQRQFFSHSFPRFCRSRAHEFECSRYVRVQQSETALKTPCISVSTLSDSQLQGVHCRERAMISHAAHDFPQFPRFPSSPTLSQRSHTFPSGAARAMQSHFRRAIPFAPKATEYSAPAVLCAQATHGSPPSC